MDVVSLNQYSIKDKENNGELDLMNATIKTKLKDLDKIRLTLQTDDDEPDLVPQNKTTNISKFGTN